jgi:hypothetical protein
MGFLTIFAFIIRSILIDFVMIMLLFDRFLHIITNVVIIVSFVRFTLLHVEYVALDVIRHGATGSSTHAKNTKYT